MFNEVATAIHYVHNNAERFLEELNALLRIPSISTQPRHKSDMELAAAWLAKHMQTIGFPHVSVQQTAGHPIVYGEWECTESSRPTLLIYGHYDVQPPDPLSLWLSPPFEPTLIDDDLYARGASDDKGQLFIHLKAIESIANAYGQLPVNIKLLIEGEEESGSENLEPFIAQNLDKLKADVAVISDTHILGKSTPSIVYALRGLCYLEVEVTGPDHDLHSGVYGGAVLNPINALCALIVKLQNQRGRILIPHFYDKVRDLSQDDRRELAEIPFSKEEWLAEAGITSEWGEETYTIIERTTARPTLDVNGIWGGYTEPGAKTVLPSAAHAKISMRLVPDQRSEDIFQLTETYLKSIAPKGVQVKVHNLHGGEAAIVDRSSVFIKAAEKAYADTFGVKPIYVREGGSIPVVTIFKELVGIDTVLLGFGLPDDRLHSPNEKFHLPNFYRGIETVIRFFDNLGKG